MHKYLYELLEVRRLVDHGSHFPLEFKPEYPLLLAAAGESKISLQGKEYTMRGNQIMLLHRDGGALSFVSPEVEAAGEVYGLSFRSYCMTARDDNHIQYTLSLGHLPEHGAILELSRHAAGLLQDLIHQAGGKGQVADKLELHLLLQRLLESLAARELYGSGHPVQDITIREATEYIRQHYAKPITRSLVAQMTGFNDSYFSSLFRKETGWSFGEYISRVRIDEAKRLLLGTPDKMGDIAYKTGFSDSSYFGKAFQKQTGMPPGQFRRIRGTVRVASMQFYGALLALGIRPLVVTREVKKSSLLLSKDFEDVAVMEEVGQTELLHTLSPELIVIPTYYYSFPDVIRQMELAAPVVAIPWGQLNKLDEVQQLGMLLGRSAEAERWIAAYEQQVASVRARISGIVDEEATVGLYELWWEREWMLPHWPVRSAYNVYAALGLTPQARIKEEVLDPNKHGRIQEEDLSLYAADHMFLIVPSDDPESYRDTLMQRSIWRQLVQEAGCELYLLSFNEFWMDDGISLEKQLAILASLLVDNN